MTVSARDQMTESGIAISEIGQCDYQLESGQAITVSVPAQAQLMVKQAVNRAATY